MSSFSGWKCKISQFKHLCYVIHVLLGIKKLAHGIWKSFSFHFIQILKKKNMSQHFRNSGYADLLLKHFLYNCATNSLLTKCETKRKAKGCVIGMCYDSPYGMVDEIGSRVQGLLLLTAHTMYPPSLWELTKLFPDRSQTKLSSCCKSDSPTQYRVSKKDQRRWKEVKRFELNHLDILT